jgi:4-amino-4-deoxy-L-arabinose transferase-like glycosyltransferase
MRKVLNAGVYTRASRKTDFILPCIFGLALSLRLAYALLAPHIDPFLLQDELSSDARDYDQLAWNLAQGIGFTGYPTFLRPTSFRAPLYPFFLAAVYLVFGRNLVAARLVQALVGALACPISAKIADKLFGRRVALLAGLGMALHPLLIYFEGWIITDTLFIFLLTLTVLLALRAIEQPTAAGAIGTGVVLGLSVLTRPQAILMLPLLLVWFAVNLKTTGTRARFVLVSLVFVATIGVLMPWTIRNYSVQGEWVFISAQGGYTFYSANNPYAFGGHVPGWPPPIEGLSESQRDREYYRRGLAWIRTSPVDFLRLLPRKFIRLWSPFQVNTEIVEYPLPYATFVKAVYLLYLCLAAYGATKLGPHWRLSAILYFPLICFVLTGLIYYGGTRYALPMAPFLVILAAVGVVHNPVVERLNQ